MAVSIDFPPTLRHTGLPDHVIKSPRTILDIEQWPWTNLASVDWGKASKDVKDRLSGAWKETDGCLVHPDTPRHQCWSVKVIRKLCPPKMEGLPKGRVLEKWNAVLEEGYNIIRDYENKMFRLYWDLQERKVAPEEFDMLSLWTHKRAFQRPYKVLGVTRDVVTSWDEALPKDLETPTGTLLKEMLWRDCIEGQLPPQGAMELILGEGTKVRVLGPKGGKASMAFTMNVIAARRFALFKKIVTSARVPGTGALKVDIQTLNGQLLEAFRMKGVVSESSPITPRMLEACWKAMDKSTSWTAE